MKTSLYLLTLLAMFCFISCNNAPKKAAPATEPVAEEKSAATVEDPDPTDQIPGDQYLVDASSKSTEQLVRLTLKDFYKDDLEKNLIDEVSRKYCFFEYDLNADGNKEIFVGLRGSYFCGSGGCTFYILDNQGNKITMFTVSDYPIVIDNVKTNGWSDLFIQSNGKYHVMKFNGQKYPSNPSVEPVLDVVPGDSLPRALNFMVDNYPWYTF